MRAPPLSLTALRYEGPSEPNIEGSRGQCGVWQRHFPPMPCRGDAVTATRCLGSNDRQYDLFQRRMRIFSTKTYSATLHETRLNLSNQHPNQH